MEILNEPAQSLLTHPNITFSGSLDLKVSKLSLHQWIQSYVIILNGNIYIYDSCNLKTPKMSEVLAAYDEIHIMQKRTKPPFWRFFLKPKFEKQPKIKFGVPSEQEMMTNIEKFKQGILFSKSYTYPKNSQNLNGISYQIENYLLPVSSNPIRTQLPPHPIDNFPNEFPNLHVLPFGYQTQFSPHPMNNSLPNPANNPPIPPNQFHPQFPFYSVVNNPSEFRNSPKPSYPLPQPPPNNASYEFNQNSHMNSLPVSYESTRQLPTAPNIQSPIRISSNDFIFRGTREEAVKELSKSFVIGSYLIRVENERNILTVQTKQSIVKFILAKDFMNNKISIQGNENQFNNLLDLVVFYTLNNLPNYDYKLTVPYKHVSNQH